MSNEEPPPPVIMPNDGRYPALSRGFNQRWLARPDYIHLISSTEGAIRALTDAVRLKDTGTARKRITVRSGGHCYENFVCGDDVRVILDVSPMCGVYYDSTMKAWCVEAGATNWHVYSHLYPLSGQALPGGSCYSVGLGGHITGGGYGLLSRQAGLTVDYLYAVEVVVVTGSRTVQRVVATRDDKDPDLNDLWWAHTGGGGGNFGVVTRFWFRNLPAPPSNVLLTGRAWNWSDFKHKKHFVNLLTAYGRYFAEHQDPGTASGRLFALLALNHVSNGQITLVAQVDADTQEGAEAMRGFLNAVDGKAVPKSGPMLYSAAEHAAIPDAWEPRFMPWLTATQALDSSGENRCGKYKSAYLRKPFTSAQIDAMWAYLGRKKYKHFSNKQALIQIDSYGSAINKPPVQTAVPQRDSILKMQYQVYWNRRSDDDPGHVRENLAWIRDTYRATFAKTGGVPVIGDVTDGCYINYPDVDLSDKKWNTSADAWWRLYYKDAYPRLQRAKRRWDPCGIFRHQQSITSP